MLDLKDVDAVFIAPLTALVLYAEARETDHALKHLARTLDERGPGVVYLAVAPQSKRPSGPRMSETVQGIRFESEVSLPLNRKKFGVAVRLRNTQLRT